MLVRILIVVVEFFDTCRQYILYVRGIDKVIKIRNDLVVSVDEHAQSFMIVSTTEQIMQRVLGPREVFSQRS